MQKEANADATQSGVVPHAFDEADWMLRLRSLNKWATTNENESAFEETQKAECVRRWQAGREEWNRWAEAMWSLRREAEIAGVWKLKDDEWGGSPGEIAKAHMRFAQIDFRDHSFLKKAFFLDFVFPGKADFSRAIFHREASFDGSKFKGGDAKFSGTQFRNDVSFNDVQFSGGEAYFADARFSGSVHFIEVCFSGGATWFNNAQFSDGAVWFTETVFSGGHALFEGTQFGDITFFDKAQFLEEGNATFDRAIFEGPITFSGAVFKRDAIFTKVQSKRGLSLDQTFSRGRQIS